MFTNSPTVGTQVTNGPLVWTWNGNAWDLAPNYGQVAVVFRPVVDYVTVTVEEFPGDYPVPFGAFAQITYV